MFEVMVTRFHAATQTFAPLMNVVVDHCSWKPSLCESIVSYQAMCVWCPWT